MVPAHTSILPSIHSCVLSYSQSHRQPEQVLVRAQRTTPLSRMLRRAQLPTDIHAWVGADFSALSLLPTPIIAAASACSRTSAPALPALDSFPHIHARLPLTIPTHATKPRSQTPRAGGWTFLGLMRLLLACIHVMPPSVIILHMCSCVSTANFMSPSQYLAPWSFDPWNSDQAKRWGIPLVMRVEMLICQMR